MEKICKNCGEKNTDTAKFCKKCGSELDIHPNIVKKSNSSIQDDKSKKIIIALIAIAAILAIAMGIYASGILNGEVPLENHDFGDVEMLVPKGSNYVETSSIPATTITGGYVGYENIGDYSDEVFAVMISTIEGSSHPSGVSLDRQEGDIKVYKDNTGQDAWYIVREVDGYEVTLIGSDDATMVKMLKSVKVKDSSKTTTTTTQTSGSTSQSMSILGGSFSTGSGLSDKTYAKIYVGPSHSGEQVTVQIWYSRDGSTLNHGNMVPAHVDSSGYLSISSADAYSKYPDHATINLYDSSGSKLLDTVSVTLSPTSGTQTF